MKERVAWTVIGVVQGVAATVFWLTWDISHETFPLVSAILMTIACVCALIVAVCS